MSSPYSAATVPKQPNACDSGCGSDAGGNKPDYLDGYYQGINSDKACAWVCPKTPPSGGCGGSSTGGYCNTKNVDTMPSPDNPLAEPPMPTCTDFPCADVDCEVE